MAVPHISNRPLWFRSWGTSLLIHLGLLAGVGLWQWWLLGGMSAGPEETLDTVVRHKPFRSGWVLPTNVSLTSLEEAAAADGKQSHSSPEVNPETPVLADFVQRELQRQIEQADSQPENLLMRLEELGGRLESASTAAGVAQVGEFLNKSLGVPERVPPETANLEVAGEFDFNSARLDDVERVLSPQGEEVFFGIMTDAAGRQLRVELNPQDGRELFRTFTLIKRFPLLEQVYRQVVQGLLDKMLAEQQR